jgi:hypothetical protein
MGDKETWILGLGLIWKFSSLLSAFAWVTISVIQRNTYKDWYLQIQPWGFYFLFGGILGDENKFNLFSHYFMFTQSFRASNILWKVPLVQIPYRNLIQ